MNLTLDDVQWLQKHYPRLATGLNVPAVFGTLEIAAYYDKETQKFVSGRRFEVGNHVTFIADQFVVDVRLKEKDHNGWPKVYDVEQRYRSIAARYRIRAEDLHFYNDGHACLGFSYPWDPPLTLEQFVTGLVEPFFYRLAYVDLYGLAAARDDLWREHSHGEAGIREHKKNVRRGSFGHPQAPVR